MSVPSSNKNLNLALSIWGNFSLQACLVYTDCKSIKYIKNICAIKCFKYIKVRPHRTPEENFNSLQIHVA